MQQFRKILISVCLFFGIVAHFNGSRFSSLVKATKKCPKQPKSRQNFKNFQEYPFWERRCDLTEKILTGSQNTYSNRKRSARAIWSSSSACSSSRARSSGVGVNLSICSTMSTGNTSRPSMLMMALVISSLDLQRFHEILNFLTKIPFPARTFLKINTQSYVNSLYQYQIKSILLWETIIFKTHT